MTVNKIKLKLEEQIVETKIIETDIEILNLYEYNYGYIDEIFYCNECNSFYNLITVSSNGYRCTECYSNDLDIIKNDETEIIKFFRKRKLEKLNKTN